MIRVEHVSKSFGSLKVLDDIDLEISQGEVISVVGASGAGKTTLLQIIGTLDLPDNGRVVYDNLDVTGLGDKELSKFRNEHVGFVFQFHNLLPEFTALENVMLPALIKGVSKSQAVPMAEELLDFLNLSQRAGHKPSQLSGGEQQRVAVARALINRPAVILADEPSGNLDSLHAKELHELFFLLRKKYNQTFVIVTHNTDLAEMADRKIIMKDGKKIV